MSPAGLRRGAAGRPGPVHVHAAVAYLRGERLLGASAPGTHAVHTTARRNDNIAVTSARGPQFLLKQGFGPAGAAAVAHEASVYDVLRRRARAGGLSRYLVRRHAYDERRGVLVLDFVRGAESMADYHARRGRFPVAVSARLGDALGALHELAGGAQAFGVRAAAASSAPGVLSIHRPTPAVFWDTSAANLELIRLVQGTPGFGEALDQLRAGWRADALIHGDIKGDNVVVRLPGGRRSPALLKLVDWETAQPGDAAWDVGAGFAEYLDAWALSAPGPEQPPDGRAEPRARRALDRVRPAARAFWRAYARRRGFDGAAAPPWLVRATRYAGARLVQTAFERAQASVRLGPDARLLLQLGFNVLQRPLEAAVHLLGIPLAPPAARPGANGVRVPPAA